MRLRVGVRVKPLEESAAGEPPPHSESQWSVAAQLYAEAQEADRAVGEAQGCVPTVCQPTGRTVELINPILRGWVNCFAVGHSSRCFSLVKDWVEKKVRRHLMRARKQKGFGWKGWSRQWLYGELGLFNGYRVRRPEPKVQPAR